MDEKEYEEQIRELDNKINNCGVDLTWVLFSIDEGDSVSINTNDDNEVKLEEYLKQLKELLDKLHAISPNNDLFNDSLNRSILECQELSFEEVAVESTENKPSDEEEITKVEPEPTIDEADQVVFEFDENPQQSSNEPLEFPEDVENIRNAILRFKAQADELLGRYGKASNEDILSHKELISIPETDQRRIDNLTVSRYRQSIHVLLMSLYALSPNDPLFQEPVFADIIRNNPEAREYKVRKSREGRYHIPKHYLVTAVREFLKQDLNPYSPDYNSEFIRITNDIFGFLSTDMAYPEEFGKKLQEVYEDPKLILCVAGTKDILRNLDVAPSYFEQGLYCLEEYKCDITRIMATQEHPTHPSLSFITLLFNQYAGLNNMKIFAALPRNALFKDGNTQLLYRRLSPTITAILRKYIIGAGIYGRDCVFANNPHFGEQTMEPGEYYYDQVTGLTLKEIKEDVAQHKKVSQEGQGEM